MAISISETPVVVDESSGPQNAGTTGDSTGNDIDIQSNPGALPPEFDQVLTDLSLSSTSAVSVAVSGATADDSTGTALITGLPAEMTDLSFTDEFGAPLNGTDSGLTTTDGTPILLFTYSDNNVLLGRTGGATGPIVFAAYLDTGTVAAGDAGATSATVWLVQFESLFNFIAPNPDDAVSPDQVIFISVSSLNTFSLEGAPSGQNLFLMYGDPDDATNDAIVVTASDAATGGTVNTGQAGGGTTIGNFNQMLDADEGLTFTFVTGANPDFTVGQVDPKLDQTEADVEDNIRFTGVKDATAASFKVVQTQPASKAGTLTLEAFTTEVESGVGFIAGYGDDGHVDILTVVVKNAAGDPIESSDGNFDTANLSISETPSGSGIYTITGVKAGYTIEYTTDGVHNRVQIDNSSPTGKGPNGADFDIGDFQLISALVEPTLFDALVFEDDGPAVDFGNLVGTGTETAQVGFWSMDAGADGLGDDALDITLDAAVLVRSLGNEEAVTSFEFTERAGSGTGGIYVFDGTLTGDFDDDGTDDSPRAFTLTVVDNVSGDDHYELVMEQAFGSVVIIDTADGALGAGGPDSVQTLTIPKPPATPITDVVFFSAKISASGADIRTVIGNGEPDPTETDIQTTPALFTFVDSARGMNVSTSGIGVANNLLEGNTTSGINEVNGSIDESFVVNPEILVSSVEVFIDNSVQGYNATTEELYYRAFYDDGTFDANYTLVTTSLGLTNKGQAASFVVEDTTGQDRLIDAVQLTMGKGDVKIPNIVFVQETTVLASDIKLEFTATVTDGDGDTTINSFFADLYANELSGDDFVLTGTASEQDSFNIDLLSDLTTYRITTGGFEVGSDLLVLIGLTPHEVTFDDSGADTIVSIEETDGGEVTTVRVVGVTVTIDDIVLG